MFFLLAFAAYIFTNHIESFKKPEGILVTFFNVGQGDSALVRTNQNKYILIDGGPDNMVVYKLGQYMPWWHKTIDFIILSHPESDHLTGLIEVLKRYDVKKVLLNGAFHSSAEYIEFLTLLNEKNIALEKADGYKVINISDVVLEIFYPKEDVAGKAFQNLNESSIIVKLQYKKNSILFTGDLEEDFQGKLLQDNLQSDVLKVPHHGASDSLGQEFLQKVIPKIAIISAGERFNHPSLRVVKMLERNNARVFATRWSGDIQIISNGNTLEVLP